LAYSKKTQTMRRVIVDVKRMSQKLRERFNRKFTRGIDDADIIEFRNHKNELVKAVEVNYKDQKFLVKLSQERIVDTDEFLSDF
jgi:DNA-directed RNA polymerase subunit delta